MKTYLFILSVMTVLASQSVQKNKLAQSLTSSEALLEAFITKNPLNALNSEPIKFTKKIEYDSNGDENTFYYIKQGTKITIGNKIVLTTQAISQEALKKYKVFLIKEAYKRNDPLTLCQPEIIKQGGALFGSITCQTTIDLSDKELKKWAETIQAKTLKKIKENSR